MRLGNATFAPIWFYWQSCRYLSNVPVDRMLLLYFTVDIEMKKIAPHPPSPPPTCGSSLIIPGIMWCQTLISLAEWTISVDRFFTQLLSICSLLPATYNCIFWQTFPAEMGEPLPSFPKAGALPTAQHPDMKLWYCPGVFSQRVEEKFYSRNLVSKKPY